MPAELNPRVRLMGAPFDPLSEAGAVEALCSADGGPGRWMVTANLDHLRKFRRDPEARELIEEADLVVADGMPLVWASRLLGAPLPERVAGSTMVFAVCAAAAARGRSVFLLGGDPGVAERAAAALEEAAPGLEVAGTFCPPFGFERDPAERERIRAAVVAADPAIVFVALGFPKQDRLIQDLRPALPGASFVGVGISLSFVAGEVSRAPVWVRQSGLEWAYRLLQEPRRLARRYLVEGIPFALRLLSGAVRHRGHADPGWGPEAT